MNSKAPLLGALVLFALVALIFLSGSEQAPPGPPPHPEPAAKAESSSSSAQPAPVVSKGPPRKADPGLTATLDRFLASIPVKPGRTKGPRPSEVLGAGLKQRLGPVDLKLALQRALKDHPEDAKLVAQALTGSLAEAGEAHLFQVSLALASNLNREAEDVLLAGLDTAPKVLRPHLVFALRGSNRPVVVKRFVSLYSRDRDSKVRAQAGFVIGERGDRIAPELLERARDTARRDLEGEDEALVKSAADVLGAGPLRREDRPLLERTLLGGTPAQRMAAFRALATGRVPPQELAPLLKRVARDPRAGAKLRGMAQQTLKRLGAGK